MKQLYLFVTVTICFIQVNAQSFLNGDFENNTAGIDQINLSNPAYNAMMANSFAFGTFGDMDIITSSTYSGGPQSGNWFVGLTGGGTDAISMTLSAPLTAGNSYTITFYDKAYNMYPGVAVQVGLSTVNNAFGTTLYTAPAAPLTGVWTQRTFTFTAPFSALYITVQLAGAPSTTVWSEADNFSFGTTITTPLQTTITANPATCYGVCNGSGSVAVSGGTPPYHYQWQGTADTTSSIDSLCAASITYVIVTDSSGATVTDSVMLPVIDPLPVFLTTNVTAMCATDTATVCAPSFFVSYMWNTGDTSSCINTQQAGSYYVTVTDANNCTTESMHSTITVYQQQHDTVTADRIIFCSGDSAYLCSSPGFVSYLWNTGSTASCITAAQAGNYYATVTDANGCTVVSNHLAINNYPLSPVSVSVNGDTLTAFNAVTYQWYFNSQPINGAVNAIYIATQTGSYSVQITDTNGCHVNSNNMNVTVTGISSVTAGAAIKVYPNPSHNTWQLQTGDEWLNSTIEIFDAEGRLVFKSEIENEQSVISFYAARGIYTLHIYNHQKNATQKLVRW